MNKPSKTAALMAICSVLSAPLALSQTKAWNVTTVGAWETPANWTPSGLPVTTDTVNITNGGTATISSAVGSVNRINSRGTTVSHGAVLLANNQVTSGTLSSTGSGLVNVQAGGTLGGVGNVYGTTTIDGTLKPGDYDYERAVSPPRRRKSEEANRGTGAHFCGKPIIPPERRKPIPNG